MKKVDEFIDKRYKLLYLGILLCAVILYSCLVGGKYIFTDETYTYALLSYGYKDIWRLTAVDVHPPLYYFLLKPFSAIFDYSLVSGKVFSIIPYLFILGFGGASFHRLFGKKMAILFMGLFFLYPYFMNFTVEVRMYSLATAFVFVNAVYAYRCYLEERPLNWVIFFVSGLATAYTHYYALLTVGIIYGILLVSLIIYKRNSIKYWLVTVALSIIGYLPWLKIFLEQLAYKANNEYWIKKITMKTISGYVHVVFGVDNIKYYFLACMLIYTAAFISVVIKKKYIGVSICALLVPIVTISIGILVSVLVRPVFVIRYAAPALSLMIAFMALALSEMDNKWLFSAIICFVIVGGIAENIYRFDYEYAPRENEVNDVFLAQYDNCDAYVSLSEGSGLSGVLSYYAGDVTVYQKASFPSPEVPYTNVYQIEEFDPEQNDTIIVFTDKNEGVTQECFESYSCQEIGGVQQHKTHYDAYLLTKNK